ncbi:MAG: hypothetical protein QXY05_02930 [Candidatus Anstonellales archaeon]
MAEELNAKRALKREMMEKPELRKLVKNKPLVEHINKFIKGNLGVRTLFRDLLNIDKDVIPSILNIILRRAKNNLALSNLSDLLLKLYGDNIIDDRFYEDIHSTVISILNRDDLARLQPIPPGSDVMDIYHAYTYYEVRTGFPPQYPLGDLIFRELMNK